LFSTNDKGQTIKIAGRYQQFRAVNVADRINPENLISRPPGGVQSAVGKLERGRWECTQAAKLEADEHDPARTCHGLGAGQLPEC
jgi:hypothetical protein